MSRPPGGRGAPRARHAAPRRPLRRVLTALGVTLAMLVVTAGAGAFVAYYRINNNITSQDISDLLGDDRPPKVAEDEKAVNILLIGSDRRTGSEAKVITGERSDTTLLLHLPADRKSATVVSIPRDSVVDLPTCKRQDGSTIPESTQRFNTAYSLGGTACTIRAVEKLTKVRIDNYVVVDFNGFRGMVNALDGVEICLPEDVDDEDSGLHLTAGRHKVKGGQALAYVRTRKGLGNGSDLQRIDRQQAFLSSMVAKVSSSGLLLRPDRLFGFLDAATKSLTTDPGLASLNDLRKLAQSVKGLDTNDVDFVTVPNETNPDDPNTVVWKPAAETLWRSIRYDRPLPGSDAAKKAAAKESDTGPTPSSTASGSADTPLKTPPERIRVQVLNGTTVAGAASRLAQKLEAQGFQVVGVGDADRRDYTTTTVTHDPAYDESGRTLGAALPGSTVEEDVTLGGTLVVTVGNGDQAVQAVAVAGSTSTPAPQETIVTRKASQDICS